MLFGVGPFIAATVIGEVRGETTASLGREEARPSHLAQRGFRYLRQGDHHYIIGEKPRSGSPEVKAALFPAEPLHRDHRENMRVKEVRTSDTDRFIICRNPEAAERDQHVRGQLVAQLSELIDGSDQLSDFKRGELAASRRIRLTDEIVRSA